MQLRQDEEYRSRVDAWLVWTTVLLLGGILVQTWLYAPDWKTRGIVLASVGIALLIPALLAIPCTYTLRNTCLRVQSGFIRWYIFYKDIQTVELSNSVWTGPALSLQRIKIVHGKGKVMLISPINREQFMAKLNERIRAVKMSDSGSEAK